MTRAPARGLTLVELLVALLVSTIVIAAATTLLVTQQRSFRADSGQRAVQETGRLALEELSRNLRGAGYGVDPALVLDFGEQKDVPRTKLRTAGRGVTSSYRCDSAVKCRDSVEGPDEVVFYTRSPVFSRPLVSVASDQIVVQGELSQPLPAGQILQVMCLVDERTRAYVTVAKEVPASPNPSPAAHVKIALEPGQTSGAYPVFPYENGELVSPCYGVGAGAGVVTKVDRFRYHVASYDEEKGEVVAHGTPGSRPYLMLDPGTLDEKGDAVDLPVVPDVEDLQLVYLYPPTAAGEGSRLVGATATVGAWEETNGIDPSVPPPAVGDDPDAKSRTTGSPANILGVRVAVVVRSAEPDGTLDRDADRTLPAAGNRPAVLGVPGYRRQLVETSVVLRNLQGRSFAYPIVDPKGLPGVNVGGG